VEELDVEGSAKHGSCIWGIGHEGYRTGALHGKGRIEHGYYTVRAQLSTGVARVEEFNYGGCGGGEEDRIP
jgi:hypothetical protein